MGFQIHDAVQGLVSAKQTEVESSRSKVNMRFIAAPLGVILNNYASIMPQKAGLGYYLITLIELLTTDTELTTIADAAISG